MQNIYLLMINSKEGGCEKEFKARCFFAYRDNCQVNLLFNKFMRHNQEDSLLQNEDIVLFINGNTAHRQGHKITPFQTYPFQHALRHKLLPYKQPFPHASQKQLMRTTKASSFGRTSSKVGFGSATSSRIVHSLRTNGGSSGQEMNSNIIRASREVDGLLRSSFKGKSLPFRVVRSLSTNTLGRKAQVEQIRRIRAHYHQYNPFERANIQSEYIS